MYSGGPPHSQSLTPAARIRSPLRPVASCESRQPADRALCRRLRPAHESASGFTLVELLVVVSIIALLVAILLPSLRKARDTAKITVCKTNMHALGTGFVIYTQAYSGRFPAGYSLWQAPWGVGDMFWHQRLVEEGLAQGKDGPKKSQAVCPSDQAPWKPYTWTTAEELIYNCSYGANPVAMIADDRNTASQHISDGRHDWVGWPYQTGTPLRGREQVRVDTLRWPSYLVLATEVEGPTSPFYFDPWLPNKDEKNKDGELAWSRHDRQFNGQTGGLVNLLHADGSVSQSRPFQEVAGLSDGERWKSRARKMIVPEG
jgi:prepilin-type N-terminal cleavage/methylation domain-containing protein